jgi:hypothetical protein
MTKEQFTISIPNDTLKELRARLTRTRFAPDFGNSRWEYGTNGAYLKELIDYWRDSTSEPDSARDESSESADSGAGPSPTTRP